MSDQGQGKPTHPHKRVSDIPEAAGIEEVEVGKTKVQLDEFFGHKRKDVPLGHILRTQEENDAMYAALVEEVARRAETNRSDETAHAKWIRDNLPSDYLEKLGKTHADVYDEARTLRNQRRREVEERLKAKRDRERVTKVDPEQKERAHTLFQKVIDEAAASVKKPASTLKETEVPISMDAIVDAVMTEIAKRLLPEECEVRNTLTERTAEEFGASFRKAAKALWTEWVEEREAEKSENPGARRYNHQAVTSTLQIPVEEDE